jgi:hypothetical protein
MRLLKNGAQTLKLQNSNPYYFLRTLVRKKSMFEEK